MSEARVVSNHVPDAEPEDIMAHEATLRDYFAAHAPPMTEQWFLDSGGASRHWNEAQAAFSYAHADAMLKARKTDG